MPDQHAAATEHELITTIAEPLGQLPGDPLSAVAVDFPIALRGYDRIAVDAYVERTTQLVAELQSTRSPEVAVRRALERVGEEISGILQRAHDTADEITARSRSEAEERLETARREAWELSAEAERQVKDLDVETERIWAERHSIVTDVRELASRLSELAEAALERFPAALPAEELAPAAPHEAPSAVAPEDHGSPHVYDGALEVAGPEPEALGEEAAAEQATAEHHAFEEPAAEAADLGEAGGPVDPGDPITDQLTVGMPPIEPWEGEPPVEPWDAAGGTFDAGEA